MPVTPNVPLNVPDVAFRTPNVVVPTMYKSPPAYISLPIPTPPATCKAPELVLVAFVIL